MERRTFFRTSAGLAAAWVLRDRKAFVFGQNAYPDVTVVEGGEPPALVRKSIEALGGMSRFVKQGDIVVLKPNMSWDRVPVQGATTNPDVVAEVVKLCLEAGAKKVKVFDRTLNEPKRCYTRSGIEKAVKAAGAEVYHVYDRKFKRVRFPEGELIKAWELYEDVLEADRLINIPIAKHHSIGGVSLGMKNLMGWLGGDRGKFHRDFPVKIVDLSAKIKVDLTILDAYRRLMRNGPNGGNPADVEVKKTLIAGVDPVAIDSYGVTMFDLIPENVEFLKEAHARGLGEINLSKLHIEKIALT